MTRRLACLGLVLGLSGCAEVDAVTSAEAAELHGPDAHLDAVGGVGDATIRVTSGIEQCSATVLSPHHFLTAGHCVRVFHTRDISTINGAFVSSAATLRCAIHPGATLGLTPPVVECDTYSASTSNANIDPSHDLALYWTSEFIDAPTRPLSPPRSCLRTEDVPFRARGYSSGPTRLTLAFTSRSWIDPVAGGPLVSDGQLQIVAGLMDGLDPGDSGGTLVEDWRDSTGDTAPILGTVSLTRTQTSVWSGASGAFHRNVDWIYSALRDEPGRCVLGRVRDTGTEPLPWPREPECVVGGEVRLDSDGDGIPDERDLCPRYDGRATEGSARGAHMTIGECANHLDSDGDFVGDDCDPYPHECNYTADTDHDGIPGDIDDCPEVFDPDQRRCDPARALRAMRVSPTRMETGAPIDPRATTASARSILTSTTATSTRSSPRLARLCSATRAIRRRAAIPF